MLFLYKPKYIGCTGVGNGNGRAVFHADSYIIIWITRLWREELYLWPFDFICVCKYGIVKSCDMSRTRSYINDSLFIGTHHGTACHAENPYVKGGNISGVSSYDGIINGWTAIFNNTDVCCGSTNLEINTVTCTKVHKRSHNRSCRAGKHGKNRTFLHLGNFHNTAVTSHDHKRNINACFSYGIFRRACGIQHFRKDRGIDCCGSGTSCQSIELCNIRSHSGWDSLFAGCFINLLLRASVIYSKCHGRDKYLCA